MSDETSVYLRVRGHVVCVQGRSAVLGRSKTCDVQLDEQGVSRRHCEVLLREDGASIRDLGSSHGTWVDGRRIEAEERVRAGAVVRLGSRGPHFELVNAIVHGRPVLGVTEPPPLVPTTIPVAEKPTVGLSEIAPTPAFVTLSTPTPAPTAPAQETSAFRAGLVWGVVVGLLLGLAVVALAGV
jgi:hypothetical protein